MATTIYRVRAPGAPWDEAVAVDDAADAEYLARRGWRVSAVTRK